MKLQILQHLPRSFPWLDRIHCFPSLDSTNLHAKIMASQGAPNGTVILAEHQTAGRGRMGRSFHSPQGKGIYLSVILRPNCKADQLMHLTCSTGVAICNAVEQTAGIRPGIKWINDLVCDNRKVGGILVEMSLNAQGFVDYAVIGVGINCTQTPEDFPEEIRHIAASLSTVTGKAVSIPTLAASMIAELSNLSQSLLLEKEQAMCQYRRDCITLGKDIAIHSGTDIKTAFALDVDSDGALVVQYPDGTEGRVNSGEVSVRGLYGYT